MNSSSPNVAATSIWSDDFRFSILGVEPDPTSDAHFVVLVYAIVSKERQEYHVENANLPPLIEILKERVAIAPTPDHWLSRIELLSQAEAVQRLLAARCGGVE